jgi:hypothetical protein
MRTTKLGAVLASLAITTGTATLVAAGPAQADTELPTQALLSLGGSAGGTFLYGTYLGTLASQVTTDGVTPVPVGSVELQQKLPGQDWKIAKTDADMSDGISFGSYGSKAKGNVRYRVHYVGGTDDTTLTTYDESYSNTVIVRTAWNLHPQASCQPRCRFFGKLSPAAKHHKVLIQVRHHGWKRYKVVRTNNRSRWSAFVKPSRGNGTYYRAVVAGTRHLIKTYALGHFTIVGRSAYRISPR